MSILRYSRKSVTEGFSEAPVLFPGFPGAMSGTRAAELWGKSCKMVNHPPAPPKSASMLGRHRNQREMGQRSPHETPGTLPPWQKSPPLGYTARWGVLPTPSCHSSPKTRSYHKHNARTGYAQARGEIQGRASWEERGATRWGSMKKDKREERYVG